MRFDIITIFPNIINAYLNESIIKRAIKRGFLDVYVHDLRKYTTDKHHKVDDKPFGGGPGMVLKIEPLLKAVTSIFGSSASEKKSEAELPKKNSLVIILDAGGKQFDSKTAQQFSKKYNHIILIAGHYEGIDSRLKNILRTKYKIQSVSIGAYVLTGGELPALVVLDALARHIPGVLGKKESLEENRYGVGVPVYTRPEVFEYKGKKYGIPAILKSGNHRKIHEWRSHQNFGS